ncbi:MAG: hypothetical protein U0Q16_39465 [Bryobacteraceae bacterium]
MRLALLTPAIALSVIAADPEPGSTLSPGGIISLFGANLGPEEGASAKPTGSTYPFELEGTSLRIDGIDAPILYVQARQVNAVVPFAVAVNRAVTVELSRNGVTVLKSQMPSQPEAFRVFEVNGQAAAINQNGTINSPDNPAPPGSIIAVFGTGGGHMTPDGVDGRIVGANPLPKLIAQVRVLVGAERAEADIFYAGAAPGIIYGVDQVNFRVPAGTGGDSKLTQLEFRVGNSAFISKGIAVGQR